MRDVPLSPGGLRHVRSAWILAAAIIIAALATLSGLAAQLANQGAWDLETEQTAANQQPQPH
jgi:hypothetical protein